MRIALVIALLAPTFASADDLTEEAIVGPAIHVRALGNLTLYPLVAKKPAPDPGYITLDEAIRTEVLTVKETDDSGAVNTLHVTSRASKPIYALAGEVVLGGKQDRIFAKHTLIEPNSVDLAVAVFCVEHGRWSGGKPGKFASANALAHTKLRQQAYRGSQSAVWAEVKDKNMKRHTANSTDTYRAALSKGDYQKKTKAALDEVRRATAGVPNLAGIAVAINGEMRGADWFAAPALYRKLEGKLLRSYIAEALDASDGKAHAAPKAQAANAFLAETGKSKSESIGDSGSAELFAFENDTIEGQMTVEKGKKAVHRTIYKKKAGDLPASAAPAQQLLNAPQQRMNRRPMRNRLDPNSPDFVW